MTKRKEWYTGFEEYKRTGEPKKLEKTKNWEIAVGLQRVDKLSTSEYLLDTAKEHIEGNISIEEVLERVEGYYREKETEQCTREADTVSARIVEVLGDKTFNLSKIEFMRIHKKLFEGIYDHAGKIRKYNITKNEWVLNGKSVIYTHYDNINNTMDYDFKEEKQFSYRGLSIEDVIGHIAKFTSDVWQVHPFGEGNTRTTAVFIIKYMETLGIYLDNLEFKRNSQYFRNALVRANYSDIMNGVYPTTEYLEKFYSNMIIGTEHKLRNRYLHIDWVEEGK